MDNLHTPTNQLIFLGQHICNEQCVPFRYDKIQETTYVNLFFLYIYFFYIFIFLLNISILVEDKEVMEKSTLDAILHLLKTEGM